jgi:hypothetical protein
MSNKINLDDIFNDDEFNSIKSEKKTSSVKSEDDRLIDSFEEINVFYDKNEREPNNSSMSEYSLMAKLKNFRSNEDQKKALKPFDRHNLLGHVELDAPSIDDILNDDDFKELDADSDLSIFKYNHTPKPEDRREADFVAQRKPLKESEFAPYEAMFQKVHKELKEGKRKFKPFKSSEKNLVQGHYYLLDGLLLYLEDADIEMEEQDLKSGNRVRFDGRTKTIFENGTYSNMKFRSLGKQLLKDGKLITQPEYDSENDLFVNANIVAEEDVKTGWIYVLKSKSTHPAISSIQNLYKIGFASSSVDDRIKNAKNEATYLFAEVQKVATYVCYNRNAVKLENLLHRFFAEACLDIDLNMENGQRLNPREWFVVPFNVIEEAIELIISEKITGYKYDSVTQIILKRI